LGAAVAWKNQAILVLGPPQSGRTTMMEEFCKLGAEPLDDSVILLDRASGLVKPLWNRQLPCSIGGVVITSFRQGARFRPKLLAPGKAALNLFAFAPAASLQPGVVLAQVAQLASSAPTWKSMRPEAHTAARRLLSMLR
jgi:hypothetical protein